MGIESPVHLLFIAIVALIVLGPKRLPGLARALGQGIREFRSSLDAGAEPAEPQEPQEPQEPPQQSEPNPQPGQSVPQPAQPTPQQVATAPGSPPPEA